MEGEPVELGRRYRDTISGFEGVATGRYEYLYGCVRISLERGKDGDLKSEVFDEQRLVEVVSEGTRRPRPTATSGGPREAPHRP